jgi:hypothetical protein
LSSNTSWAEAVPPSAANNASATSHILSTWRGYFRLARERAG